MITELIGIRKRFFLNVVFSNESHSELGFDMYYLKKR